jgi:hypothetical protein
VRRYRSTQAPRALRRTSVRLDNLILVPASLLPVKEDWQRIANGLPSGDMLLVVPRCDKPRRVVAAVARRLRKRGRRIAVVDQEFHRSKL